MKMTIEKIEKLLGKETKNLLGHKCKTVSKEKIHITSKNHVDEIFTRTDRNSQTIRNLQSMFSHGRLADTGYLSILPVDQGIEHSAGASFAPNPEYFDPEKIVQLAIEGGCNAVASTYGVLAAVARKYTHKIPFVVKINHNELLSHPNTHDQILFANVQQCWDMGAIGIGATIYFGSEESGDQLQEVREAFALAHELGMFTILWCYTRNPAFKVNDIDYHGSADLTSQANHIGVTIGADIIKQKLPTNNGGYKAVNKESGPYGKIHEKMYTSLCSDHPIDLVRYQVIHNYMGRIGLINSGGASGKNDLAEAVRTAILNKRGGGLGLISGRKAFQKPFSKGVELLNAIQDVYLNPKITIA